MQSASDLPPAASPSWVGLSTTQRHLDRIQRGVPTPDSWPHLEAKVRELIRRRIPAHTLPPEAEVDDLVQVVLSHLLQNIAQFRVAPGASFAGWVVWLARRRAVSMWRRFRASPVRGVGGAGDGDAVDLDELACDDGPSPATVAHIRDVAAEVRRAVTSLSAKDQRVLTLREDQGLTFAEIATAMCFEQEATARCRYHRAQQRRRRVLSRVYGGAAES